MTQTAISTAHKTLSMSFSAFAVFHPECYPFPTAYIHDVVLQTREWQGYDWTYESKRERWIRLVGIETVAIWATCDECGKKIVNEETARTPKAAQNDACTDG